MFWEAKIFFNFFKNILATALKSYIKWLLQIFFFCKRLKKSKKLELSPQNFRYDVLHLLYSVITLISSQKSPTPNIFGPNVN